MSGNPEVTPGAAAPVRSRSRRLPILIVGAIVLALGYQFWPSGGETTVRGTVFVAKRGDLELTVVEGGNVAAMESQEIRSEVEGQTKILSIIPEGTMISQEDIDKGTVLVELDSSELENKLTNQEIQFQSTEAAFIEAEQAYDIQISQNESLIKAAELKAKFALLDFQKFLGKVPVTDILGRLKLDKKAEDIRAQRFAKPSVTLPPMPIEPIPPVGMGDAVAPPVPGEGGAAMATAQAAGAGPREGRQRRGGEERRAREAGQGGDGGGQGDAPSDNAGGPGRGPGGGGFGGGDGTPPKPTDILADDALIDKIAAAASEKGMPVEPGRFKEMLKSRGTVDGTLSSGTVERMSQMGIDVRAMAVEMGKIKPGEVAQGTPAAEMRVEIDLEYMAAREAIDFTTYADTTKLEDGDARQEIRKLEDDEIVARQAHQLAVRQLDGTKKLVEKKFATENELDRDELDVQMKKIKVDSAESALDLHIRYTFPKSAEKFLSEYEDALMALERTQKEALSKLAQADAKLKSSQARFAIERTDLEKLRTQIDKCTIRASRMGLVVYGGAERRPWDDPIQEGVTIRQQQMIINIPDLSQMAIVAKIHESAVKSVQVGQKARMTVEAFADKALAGSVHNIGVLPDGESRWSNPDLKVFSTKILIDGANDWLRPGMSASVEIVVDQLTDVLYIPIQAVSSFGEERVVYVDRIAGEPERRIVKTGTFNAEFIVIESGLAEGETVLLRAPSADRGPEAAQEDEKPEEPAPAAAPAAPSA